MRRLLLFCGVMLGLAAVSASGASAAGLHLRLIDVGSRPLASDNRYLYIGPSLYPGTGTSAAIWDSRTGVTQHLRLREGCNGGPPVMGGGVAFFVCGTSRELTGWIYQVAGRRWIAVPQAVFDRSCRPGDSCGPDAAGSDWVAWNAAPACDSDDCSYGTDVFDNLRTGRVVDVDADPETSPMDVPCLELFGCRDLDGPRLKLRSSARACRPLPAWDFAPIADDWVVLQPPDSASGQLFLQRCGSPERRRISGEAVAEATDDALLVWEPATFFSLRVYNADLQQTFTVQAPDLPTLFTLMGADGDRIWGTDVNGDNYVGVLPQAVLSGSARPRRR